MQINVHQSWKPYLKDEFLKPYFQELINFIKEDYQKYNCFPSDKQIFNAFEHCHFEDTKVVIIGQDPYHGIGQANGLCFSVNDDIAHPPSLIKIFKEIEQDLGIPYPKSGNLIRWADQGVLLLNATLSVRAHEAGSHQNKGWETFTDSVIKLISDEKENVIFLLWGGFAKKKAKLVDEKKHTILTSGHPSPLSANRGYWFGNKHFSKSNKILINNGIKDIDW